MRRLIMGLLMIGSCVGYTPVVEAKYEYCKRVAAYVALAILVGQLPLSKEESKGVAQLFKFVWLVDCMHISSDLLPDLRK